ncbi:MAG: DUF4270 family protein [Bacteroidales bacterium]
MKKNLWVIMVILTTLLLFSSCSWEPELGQDLLPPGDRVFLFHDTIFEIPAYTVSGAPVETSDRSLSPTTTFMLGKMADTITGISEAALFTQFNPTTSYKAALNTEIDSMVFSLYITGYFGNMDEPFNIQLYEATRRIYMDSVYYSNFDMEGAYNPEILAEATITPQSGDTVAMLIQNQAFIQKFLDVQDDTALFYSDSVFKDYFNGFYLTASSSASDGAIAMVVPSSIITRLSVKYANDSTEVDSTVERDFRWATFSINEFSSQKINIFKHDYSGVSLEKIIDNPDIETPVCYVQGMGGVNTSFYFGDLEEWIEGGKVAVNSARIIFDVYPEQNGGLALEDLATRLMLYTESGQDSLIPPYDFLAIYQGTSGDDSQFGGQLRAVSKGMFFDTTYRYQFNIPLHFQSMVDGADIKNKFILQLYNAKRNPGITKVWSNLYTNPKRIRLEIVYIKL